MIGFSELASSFTPPVPGAVDRRFLACRDRPNKCPVEPIHPQMRVARLMHDRSSCRPFAPSPSPLRDT